MTRIKLYIVHHRNGRNYNIVVFHIIIQKTSILQKYDGILTIQVTLQSLTSYLLPCTDALVKKLLPLGFTRATIRKELIETNGDLNEAANNLLYQLPDSKAQGVLASIKKEERKFIISSVKVWHFE